MTLQQAVTGYNPLTIYLVPLSKLNPKLAECIYTFIVTFYIRMLDTCLKREFVILCVKCGLSYEKRI